MYRVGQNQHLQIDFCSEMWWYTFNYVPASWPPCAEVTLRGGVHIKLYFELTSLTKKLPLGHKCNFHRVFQQMNWLC